MKLLVLLADPLTAFWQKGEIKPRYYNPGDAFSEVHLVTPGRADIDAELVRTLAGSAHLTVHPMPFGEYVAGGYLPNGRLGRLMRAVRPDVVRAYDPGPRGSLAVYWAKRLGVPSVVSVHADLDDQRRHEPTLRYRLRAAMETYALSRATVVICVSRYLQRYARKYGAKHIEVIYNRVNLAQFTPAPPQASDCRSGADRRPLRIVSVCRLAPQKDPACLIRAIVGVEAELTLIGDGPLRGRVEALVRWLGLEDRVRFVRAVPHAQMAAWYRQADVFAIATRYEGFCIPVLEAMAAGLPVVASRIDPIEELLEDTGCLVEHRPEAFRCALQMLQGHPAMRDVLRARARVRALEYDGSHIEEHERMLYARLCRPPPNATALDEAGDRYPTEVLT